MIDAALIQKLKQTNISQDAEKTKTRIEAAWQKATPAKQDTFYALSGLKSITVYRARKNGTASARLILALAVALNTDPTYFTGEAGKRGRFTEEKGYAFLQNLGYVISSDALEVPAEDVLDEPVIIPMDDDNAGDLPAPDVGQMTAKDLSMDDLIILLRSLMLRAEVEGVGSDVKRCAMEVRSLLTVQSL